MLAPKFLSQATINVLSLIKRQIFQLESISIHLFVRKEYYSMLLRYVVFSFPFLKGWQSITSSLLSLLGLADYACALYDYLFDVVKWRTLFSLHCGNAYFLIGYLNKNTWSANVSMRHGFFVISSSKISLYRSRYF